MKKAMSVHKTVSRMVIEIIIFMGVVSVTIGVLQKVMNINSIYDPRLLGLTPKEFLAFGGICFVLALTLAARRILKHLESRV